MQVSKLCRNVTRGFGSDMLDPTRKEPFQTGLTLPSRNDDCWDECFTQDMHHGASIVFLERKVTNMFLSRSTLSCLCCELDDHPLVEGTRPEVALG